MLNYRVVNIEEVPDSYGRKNIRFERIDEIAGWIEITGSEEFLTQLKIGDVICISQN